MMLKTIFCVACVSLISFNLSAAPAIKVCKGNIVLPERYVLNLRPSIKGNTIEYISLPSSDGKNNIVGMISIIPRNLLKDFGYDFSKPISSRGVNLGDGCSFEALNFGVKSSGLNVDVLLGEDFFIHMRDQDPNTFSKILESFKK